MALRRSQLLELLYEGHEPEDNRPAPGRADTFCGGQRIGNTQELAALFLPESARLRLIPARICLASRCGSETLLISAAWNEIPAPCSLGCNYRFADQRPASPSTGYNVFFSKKMREYLASRHNIAANFGLI
jgi:hypothetical protein